ncbi:hypothetical protein EZV62_006950 [Acer yangbiense]|uniref:Uncharacterized protein n=1 Tax=Acer yangbiense TaxID=1000413 RepID=A0A5C7I8X3_9ROSI|nr:hypothetical protein EZV62_006950 [Acer yangbiense]
MEMCLSGGVRGGKQAMGGAQGGPTESHNNNAGGRHSDAVDSTPSSDLVVFRLFSLQLSVAKSFEYIITMLVAVLQLSSKESPFKTHPVQTWVFVVATIIYGLAFQLSNADVAIISGSLSTVLLVSIFVPHSLGFLIFIPWSFVPIIVAYQPICLIFNNIHDACLTLRLDRQMIMDFISKFLVIWRWLTRSSSTEQEQEQEQPRPRVSP